MLRLHDDASSGNCFKVRLLLALLDAPYERVPVDIFAGDTLTDEFARLNPLRQTPVLELEDGTAIAQSNAILAYVADGTSYLPPDRLARAQVASWLSFEQEWIMAPVSAARFRRATGRPGWQDALPDAREGVAALDAHLRDREWVATGAPTIADVALYGYTHAIGQIDVEAPPALAAWLRRVEGLPGFANDLAPFPPHARPGASRSIYD